MIIILFHTHSCTKTTWLLFKSLFKNEIIENIMDITTEESKELYFQLRVLPKLTSYSLSDEIEEARFEWIELRDSEIPRILATIKDFEDACPIIEEKYKLVPRSAFGTDVGKCVCGQHIQQHCLIHNPHTNYVMWVGNECISRFKTKALNAQTYIANKGIISLLNSIRNSAKACEKLKLSNSNNRSTNVIDVEHVDVDETSSVDNNEKSVNTNHENEILTKQELYKICRIPNDKQLETLRRDGALDDNDLNELEALRQKFNRMVTTRDGERHIRTNNIDEVNKVINANTKLFSKYSQYLQCIDLKELIRHQSNNTLKQDYMDRTKPTDHTKKYVADLDKLDWIVTGETRTCQTCDKLYWVSLPIHDAFTSCRPCLVKSMIKQHVDSDFKLKVKRSSIEPVIDRYGVDGVHLCNKETIKNETIKCAVKCTTCFKYEMVIASLNVFITKDTYKCWKCSFTEHLNSIQYHKRVDCPRQSIRSTTKILKADLTYTFTPNVVVSYKCEKCKGVVEKIVDTSWNVSYHKHCLNCYRQR